MVVKSTGCELCVCLIDEPTIGRLGGSVTVNNQVKLCKVKWPFENGLVTTKPDLNLQV